MVTIVTFKHNCEISVFKCVLFLSINSDLLLLLSEMCTCLCFYIQCMNTLTIMLFMSFILWCTFNVNLITPIYCAISIKILNWYTVRILTVFKVETDIIIFIGNITMYLTSHWQIIFSIRVSSLIWFDLLCLMPLSEIFQLYHGDQF